MSGSHLGSFVGGGTFSDLDRLPSSCPSTGIGKVQEALKAKGYNIGRYGVDCKYGDDTNTALGKWVATLDPSPASAIKLLEWLGLTPSEAQEAGQKIVVWLTANPTVPSAFLQRKPMPSVPAGPTGVAVTPGASILDIGPRPPKPPPMPDGMVPPLQPPPETLPYAAPGAPATAQPWFQTYKWHLVGGSVLLALGTISVILLTRKGK